MDKNKNKLFYALSSEGLNSVFSQIGGVCVCVGGLLWLCPGPTFSSFVHVSVCADSRNRKDFYLLKP